MKQIYHLAINPTKKVTLSLFVATSLFAITAVGLGADAGGFILTPTAPSAPRINGPNVFGVRPGSPLLYTIPATGNRPMNFSAENLPGALDLNSTNGQITGTLKRAGEYKILLRATNDSGSAQKNFRIVVGEKIALTPPMGWNSWNCWAGSVSQEKVLRSARALVASGLMQHGWSYINIDDAWQGKRDPATHALQGNKKFPDMKSLCAEIHALGLKAGIYSTPWVSSYAGYPGGSSDSLTGDWDKSFAGKDNWRFGKYDFTGADARQWADWGFDYLKYDWRPNDLPHIKSMSRALRKTGRDIVFSLSNTAPFADVDEIARWANCWRTTGDIWDHWAETDYSWRYGVSEIAFSQDRWAIHAGPGHWNDPDMLVVGQVGWSDKLHPSRLTPDEQYAHISMWCLLSAPLMIGCDLERLDDFTMNLLCNDEVLALDQDALGKSATRFATIGPVDAYVKELEDGAKAVGFFNRDSAPQTIAFNKLPLAGISKPQHVRDLWRQQDLPDLPDLNQDEKHAINLTIPAHGVQLLKFSPIGIAK